MSYDQLLYLSAVILFAASCICGSLQGKEAAIEDRGLTILSTILLLVAIIVQLYR